MSSHARSRNRSKSLHRIAPPAGALTTHGPGRVSQDALDWSGREESSRCFPIDVRDRGAQSDGRRSGKSSKSPGFAMVNQEVQPGSVSTIRLIRSQRGRTTGVRSWTRQNVAVRGRSRPEIPDQEQANSAPVARSTCRAGHRTGRRPTRHRGSRFQVPSVGQRRSQSTHQGCGPK
jgi:hypothetical protein